MKYKKKIFWDEFESFDDLEYDDEEAFEEAGIPLLCEAPTNQIFPIFPNALAEEINSRYLTTFQCKPDPEHTCLRFCTSWITNEEAVADFVENFKDMVIKYR